MKIKDAIKRTIASNIKRARIAANMTQAEAAQKLGITAQAISNFERGINGIENSLLLRMCKIYNTTMSHILGEEDEQEENAPTLTEKGRRDGIPNNMNVLRIAGRDGSFEERLLTDDQMATVKAFLNLLPNASDDL